MNISIFMIAYLALTSGTHYVDENQTIQNVLTIIEENIEYKLDYGLAKSMRELDNTRTGDCTEVANFLKNRLNRYGIPAKFRKGWAVCNGQRVTHDWIEVRGVPYDVRSWGNCTNFEVGR